MFGINVRGIKNHIKTECDAKLHVMMCQTDNKTWSCSECGKEMKNRIDIWRHIEAKHVTNHPGYKCDFCDIQVKTKNALRIHISTHHPFSQ